MLLAYLPQIHPIYVVLCCFKKSEYSVVFFKANMKKNFFQKYIVLARNFDG